MSERTWVIVGATSIIAEQFAHIAAVHQNELLLIGRDKEQLLIISQDIQLRYKVPCRVLTLDILSLSEHLSTLFPNEGKECDLFIAHSDFTENAYLTSTSINHIIDVNIRATVLLIHHYFELKQSQYNLIYLSSVAACRGRAKNSLYGATKAAIELYLQGLQQSANKTCHITIARLGFIDTRQTYGLPGVFYAAKPKDCARACWSAIKKHKRQIYYPGFWFFIMTLIIHLPFFLYKRIK